MNKYLLRAVRDVLLRSGLQECSLFSGVYNQLKSICVLEGLHFNKQWAFTWKNFECWKTFQTLFTGDFQPCVSIANMCVQRLADEGFIAVNECPVDLYTKISLKVEPDEIHMALST